MRSSLIMFTSLCCFVSLTCMHFWYTGLFQTQKQRSRPLHVDGCRKLRGFDDIDHEHHVSYRDGYNAHPEGDVTSLHDELDVIEACQGVRPVLISTYATDRRKFNKVRDGLIVPNIVHYIHINAMNTTTWTPLTSVSAMNFLQHVSYLSVHRFIRPRYIFVHGDALPHGHWWNRTINVVSNLYFVNESGFATHVYGKRLGLVEHISDILRYKISYELGGIYLDSDVLVLKSFDALRNFSLTLGREGPNALANGIIVAKPGSAFFKLWLSTYRTYNPKQFAFHSVNMPERLSKILPHLVHVEDSKLIYPSWNQSNLLFGNKHYDWSKQYACHVWKRMNPTRVPKTPDAIKGLNSTLGQMMRLIYFGKKELIV